MKITPSGIEAMGDNENKLYEVRKHWFGLAIVYIQFGIGFAAGIILLSLVGPVAFPNAEPAQRRMYLSVIAVIMAVLIWLILSLYTYIYYQSKLIISNKNLTQVLQHGLFNRKVSELSMANVEDVTANQRGFFASIFGYGDLLVETAGEQANFDFLFCPNPGFYGKVVLDARQKYIDSSPTKGRKA